jgi:PHD/YefM family antitoxin component YafN of YafNO toxin-antitoxin module
MTTKTLTVSKLRTNLADALDAVTSEDILIVTRRGKTGRAIIDLDSLEDLLAASDPEYLRIIQAARNSKEYLSHDEVFGNII